MVRMGVKSHHLPSVVRAFAGAGPAFPVPMSTALHDPIAAEWVSSNPKPGRARVRRAWLIPAVLLAAGAQVPLVAELEERLRSEGTYRFAPLALVAAVILAAIRAKRSTAEGTVWPSVLLCAAAALLTGGAIVLRSPAVGVAAFVVTLLFGVDAILGPAARRAALPVWLGLWLAVPSPVAGQGRLVDSFEEGVAGAASATLDLVGVRHRIVDGAVETPGRTFALPARGGSVFLALVAVSCAAVALRRGPIWSAVLLTSAVLWWFIAATFAGSLPVLLALREGGSGFDGPDWWADAAAVGATLLLAWSTDRWLSWLMPHGGPATWGAVRGMLSGEIEPDEPTALGRADEGRNAGGRSAFTRLGAVVATGVFAAVAALWLAPPLGSAVADSPPEAEEHRS